ncbi:MAG: hypothetical protein U1E05_11480, partial [Patescibacteria group bacterium]|nr:hypothetical protein [Patescibacteria group bacterium]
MRNHQPPRSGVLSSTAPASETQPPVTRRRFLQAGAAGAAMAAGALRSVQAASLELRETTAAVPVSVGDARHLFADDRLLDAARTRDAVPTMNRPVGVERVLTPEMPWETLGFIFYSTVIEDEKEIKLYYGSYGWDGRIQRHFCLATSSDGVHFERARMGAKVYDGKSVATNFMFPTAVEVGVFLDPRAERPDTRYRMVYSAGGIEHPDRGGMYTATSADGIRWAKNPTRLLPFIPDSQHTAYWDQRLQKYVIYMRAWGPRGREVCRAEVADIDQPWPYDTSATLRYPWGKDKTPTLGQQYPSVMAPDEQDPENLDIYTNVVTPYPYAANAAFAFPAVYFKFVGPDWKERALSGNDGNFEVQL